MAPIISTTEIIGKQVQNPSGEKIGDIRDMIIDVGEGYNGYAILSFEKLGEVRDKLFAIPVDILEFSSDGKIISLDMDWEKIKKTPGFDHDEWPIRSNRNFVQEVDDFYGSNLRPRSSDIFSEALIEELEDTGVTLTVLCPGPTDTNFFKRADMENACILEEGTLMEPHEVAEEGYRALMEEERIIIPGINNKLLTFSRRLVPKSLQAERNRKLYEVNEED